MENVFITGIIAAAAVLITKIIAECYQARLSLEKEARRLAFKHRKEGKTEAEESKPPRGTDDGERAPARYSYQTSGYQPRQAQKKAEKRRGSIRGYYIGPNGETQLIKGREA